MIECTKALWIFSGFHYAVLCVGALRFTLLSETNTSTLVLPITNASDTNLWLGMNCTGGNTVVPYWFVNGSRYYSSLSFLTSLSEVNGTYFSYLNVTLSSFVGRPMVIQCGYNDSSLSNRFSVVWIKEPPRFNCTLNVTMFAVSWDHCVENGSYISNYIIYITTSNNNRSYNTTGTTFVLLNEHIVCGIRYIVTICPINPVGKGEAANSYVFVPCPSFEDSLAYSTQTMLEPLITSLDEDRNFNLTYLLSVPIFAGVIMPVAFVLALLVKRLHNQFARGKNDKGRPLQNTEATICTYFVDHTNYNAGSTSVKISSIRLEDCPAYDFSNNTSPQ